MLMSLGSVLLYCELGHQVSSAFEESNSAFDRMKWYSFPVDMWPMLPIIIAAAQQPIRFSVFGSVSCSREDFKMVRLFGIRSSFKYGSNFYSFFRLSTMPIRILWWLSISDYARINSLCVPRDDWTATHTKHTYDILNNDFIDSDLN